MEAAIELLAEHGWTPRKDGNSERAPHEFWLRYRRQYTQRDPDQSGLLLLEAKAYREGLFRTEEGPIKIDARKLKPRADFAEATPERLVVSRRVRHLIEEAGLRHVVFHPTVAVHCEQVEHTVVPWNRLGGPRRALMHASACRSPKIDSRCAARASLSSACPTG